MSWTFILKQVRTDVGSSVVALADINDAKGRRVSHAVRGKQMGRKELMDEYINKVHSIASVDVCLCERVFLTCSRFQKEHKLFIWQITSHGDPVRPIIKTLALNLWLSNQSVLNIENHLKLCRYCWRRYIGTLALPSPFSLHMWGLTAEANVVSSALSDAADIKRTKKKGLHVVQNGFKQR